MKFYAYIPREDGKEPLGTARRIKFELKTLRGATRRAKRILGENYRLFAYYDWHDSKSFFPMN